KPFRSIFLVPERPRKEASSESRSLDVLQRIQRNQPWLKNKADRRDMLDRGGIPPSQGIGGGPKERGRPAYMSRCHPPPPTNRIGGVGRIPREKCRSCHSTNTIWRRGCRRLLVRECPRAWPCLTDRTVI